MNKMTVTIWWWIGNSEIALKCSDGLSQKI